MMRIITGKARGVKLATLDNYSTRPTSERAKEAVFSMLQFDIEGKEVLDLFGGSGQLGLEAVSRGAAHATIVDCSKEAVGIINKNATATKLANDCTVVCSDWRDYISSVCQKKFDIVFVDPPYALRLVPTVLEALYGYKRINSGALIVCESAEDDIFGEYENKELINHFETVKKAKYGVAHITVVKPLEENK